MGFLAVAFDGLGTVIWKFGRSGTWGIFAKIRRIGKVVKSQSRKIDGASIGLPFDDLFVRNRPMKKQKLHQLAKFAAISIIGTIPFVGISDASAQQNGLMPPIVQRSHNSAASIISPSYSYGDETSKPLTPVVVSPTKIVPPIVSGKRIGVSAIKNTAQAKVKTAVGNNLLAPIGSGVKQVAGLAEPAKVARAFSPTGIPVRAQGSGSRSFGAPAVSIQPPSGLTTPRAPVISGSLVSQGQVGPSVLESQPSVAAPNYFDSAPINNSIGSQSVVSGCSDCGGNSVGGCDTCNGNANVNQNQVNCDYGTYGSVSAARRYAYLEFLYLTREDGDINNSNFNPLGEFDFDPGWRITLGQRSDMTQGRELSYFGTSGIQATQETTSASNNLNALFTPAGGLLPADLSAFSGASEHIQTKETDLHSVELNRVRWGWDVLKSFVGFRYIYLADDFQQDSTAPVLSPFGAPTGLTETGQFRIDTNNHLFGGHIGAELFYDIGYRFSLSGVSKFGVYANINEVDNFLVNNDVTLLDTEDNSATISTTYDLQFLAHYQIRQTARVRVGYNALFLGNVATVADNFTPFVSPFTGFDGSDNDDAFIHGFTFGLEIYR